MMAGETRRFSASDNLGRRPSDVSWTVSNANIATLTTNPVVTLTGVLAGEVTLTASWHGLTATTHATVLGANMQVPAGTIFWASPTFAGPVQSIVQGALALDGIKRTYVVEVHGDPATSVGATIRAFDEDGSELWAADAGGIVGQLSGDPAGGVVALINDDVGPGSTGLLPPKLMAFSAAGTTTDLGRTRGGFAIHPNGVVYALMGRELVGLDSMAGPVTIKSNSPWPYAQATAQSTNAAATPGTGVYVKGHFIVAGQKHAGIRMVPRNQVLA